MWKLAYSAVKSSKRESPGDWVVDTCSETAGGGVGSRDICASCVGRVARVVSPRRGCNSPLATWELVLLLA
jgi:hypothetical protein